MDEIESRIENRKQEKQGEKSCLVKLNLKDQHQTQNFSKYYLK